MEKLITKRFFGRKERLNDMMKWMQNQYHKLIYAEDILRLNEASRCNIEMLDQVNLCAISVPANVPEVKRMETDRAGNCTSY